MSLKLSMGAAEWSNPVWLLSFQPHSAFFISTPVAHKAAWQGRRVFRAGIAGTYAVEVVNAVRYLSDPT